MSTCQQGLKSVRAALAAFTFRASTSATRIRSLEAEIEGCREAAGQKTDAKSTGTLVVLEEARTRVSESNAILRSLLRFKKTLPMVLWMLSCGNYVYVNQFLR